MKEHVQILGTVLFLLAGAWSISYIIHKKDWIPSQLYRPIFLYSLFYNTYNVYYLVRKYIQVNLASSFQWFLNTSKQFSYLLVLLFYGASLFFILKIVFYLMNRRFPPALAWINWIACALPVSVACMWWIWPTVKFIIIADEWLAYYPIVVLTLQIASMVVLIGQSGKSAEKDWKRIAVGFAVTYGLIGIYCIEFALSFLGKGINQFVTKISEYDQFINVAYNLAPYLWLQFFFIPWLKERKVGDSEKNLMENFGTRHSLTNREIEITQQLFEGKSYKQIGYENGISISTVKNHVYNIYRKVNIGSRHELVTVMLNSDSDS